MPAVSHMVGSFLHRMKSPGIFILVGVACVIASCCILLSFSRPESFELLFYFGYMAAACTFFPLPVPPMVMDFGGRFDPLLVSLIGAVGTCLAAMIDYALMGLITRYRFFSGITRSRTYTFCVRCFNRAAFVSLVISSFLVIPLEPVRFLAATTGYNRGKYVLAVFLGRLPLYLLFAKLQRILLIPRGVLIAVIVAILALSIGKMLISSRNGKEAGAGTAAASYEGRAKKHDRLLTGEEGDPTACETGWQDAT